MLHEAWTNDRTSHQHVRENEEGSTRGGTQPRFPVPLSSSSALINDDKRIEAFSKAGDSVVGEMAAIDLSLTTLHCIISPTWESIYL